MTFQAFGRRAPEDSHHFAVHFRLLFMAIRAGSLLMNGIQDEACGVMIKAAIFPPLPDMAGRAIPFQILRNRELSSVRILLKVALRA